MSNLLLRTVLIAVVITSPPLRSGYCPTAAVLSGVANGGSAQKSTTNKFQHAIDRSADAARIVSLLALLPDSGLPKELVDKAEAVGVFPKVTKETALFTQMSQGYGVISARVENGWTMPAFYQFAAAATETRLQRTKQTG